MKLRLFFDEIGAKRSKVLIHKEMQEKMWCRFHLGFDNFESHWYSFLALYSVFASHEHPSLRPHLVRSL